MKYLLYLFASLMLLACSSVSQTENKTANGDSVNLTLTTNDESLQTKIKRQLKFIDELTEKPDDKTAGYWKRAAVYTSPNLNEKFYQVRASDYNGQLRFYFLGVTFPIKADVFYAKIYELDTNKTLYIIDSVKITNNDENDVVFDEIHLEPFMLRQINNLILFDNTLYYYKESEKMQPDDSYQQQLKKRKYYEYELGSKHKSVSSNIPADYYPPGLFLGYSQYRLLVNASGTLLARCDNYSISFFAINDWEALAFDLYSDRQIDYYSYTDSLPHINCDFKKYFPIDSTEHLGVDRSIGNVVFFGGMSWHIHKDILYFDNSGFDYRCIWEADVTNKTVKKIIPEHTAIHPYFFNPNNEYIVYTDENKIMIASSPDNKN